jgi:hypothetical protein
MKNLIGPKEALSRIESFKGMKGADSVRLQMVWDNLSCLGTEALARLA